MKLYASAAPVARCRIGRWKARQRRGFDGGLHYDVTGRWRLRSPATRVKRVVSYFTVRSARALCTVPSRTAAAAHSARCVYGARASGACVATFWRLEVERRSVCLLPSILLTAQNCVVADLPIECDHPRSSPTTDPHCRSRAARKIAASVSGARFC